MEGVGTAVTRAATDTTTDSRNANPDIQPNDLAATIQKRVKRALDDHDADGATVTVVANGDTILADGFGHAYLNPDVAVESDTTLFRIGSVSKVFPFVAAIRLIDDGQVDPHDPIAEMLESVSVPDPGAYADPLALAHLATHTTGFETRSPGQVATAPDEIRPLPEALQANDPTRVSPPGELPLYMNYNAGLAGQLVADVLGTDFASAVQRLVFDPLGIDKSTFAPLPPALVGGRTDAAAEVNWYSEMTPASGMSATATEMAKLLRALVGDGAIDGSRLLSLDAVEALHRQWYTPHEQLAGASFGMERQRRDGTLVVGHHGGVPDFSTDLRLLPEEGVGLFISAHGTEANDVQTAATETFLDHVASVSELETTPDGPPTRAETIIGTYRSRNVTDTASFEKALYGITRPSTSVHVDDDGTLVTDNGGTTHRWVEVAPLVFRRTDGEDTLVFQPSDGSTTYLFRATDPRAPVESVPWYGQGRLHGPLALIAGLAVFSGAAGWPLAAVWRRYRGGTSPTMTLTQSRWTAGAAGSVLLSFVVVAFYGVTERWLYEPPSGFDLLFTLPIIAAVLSLVTVGIVTQAWYERQWSLPHRSGNGLVPRVETRSGFHR